MLGIIGHSHIVIVGGRSISQDLGSTQASSQSLKVDGLLRYDLFVFIKSNMYAGLDTQLNEVINSSAASDHSAPSLFEARGSRGTSQVLDRWQYWAYHKVTLKYNRFDGWQTKKLLVLVKMEH